MFCLFSVSLRVDYSFISDTELPLGVLSTCCTLLMWMMLLLLLQMRLLLLQLLQHLFLFRWSLALLAWGPQSRGFCQRCRGMEISTPRFIKMLQAAGHNAQQHAADAAVEAVAVATRIVLHGRRMFACWRAESKRQLGKAEYVLHHMILAYSRTLFDLLTT